MVSRIVFVGTPGAGKGTQAAILQKRLEVPVVASGNMFREAITEGSSVGKQVAQFVSSGLLVPDKLANVVIFHRLREPDCRSGFILDGYPRSIGQAEAFDIFLSAENQLLDRILYFKVEPALVVERMGHRRMCKECGTVYNLASHPPKSDGICDRCGSGLVTRVDDRPETIQSRLAIYEKTTRPLLEYYNGKGILSIIHASESVQDVSRQIQTVCG